MTQHYLRQNRRSFTLIPGRYIQLARVAGVDVATLCRPGDHLVYTGTLRHRERHARVIRSMPDQVLAIGLHSQIPQLIAADDIVRIGSRS